MPGCPLHQYLILGEPTVIQRRWGGLKFHLESFKHTQVFPLGRLSVIWTVDGFKTVVMDHMVGRAEVSSVEVLDQGDVFSMTRGHSHELTTAGTGLPLGHLVASLGEPRFQHIAGGSPNTSLTQSLEVVDSSCEKLNGSYSTVPVGGVVVQPSAVLKTNSPLGGIVLFRPVQGGMDH